MERNSSVKGEEMVWDVGRASGNAQEWDNPGESSYFLNSSANFFPVLFFASFLKMKFMYQST